jgi:hypothetical protein
MSLASLAMTHPASAAQTASATVAESKVAFMLHLA